MPEQSSPKTSSSIASKVGALLSSAGAEPAPDAQAGAPPTGQASGAGSAAAGPDNAAVLPDASGAQTPAAAPTPEQQEARTRHELLAEKLKQTRERNTAKGERARARAEREEADHIRREAEARAKEIDEQRATWTELGKSGNILETLKAAGRDPREVFEQMKAEAIREGTPEAQIAAVTSKFEKALTDANAKIDQLTKERDEERRQTAAQALEQRFAADFTKSVDDPAYDGVRDEYGDDRLLTLARNFRDMPTKAQVDLATSLGVRLTNPRDGVTMKDILSVLKAAQDEHDKARDGRRAARTASRATPPATQAGSDKPQAPGASAKTKAAPAVIGNSLAASEANGGPAPGKGATASARIRDRARRLER